MGTATATDAMSLGDLEFEGVDRQICAFTRDVRGIKHVPRGAIVVYILSEVLARLYN